MPKIFISYRREDSQSASYNLYEKLEDHFGPENIFFDVDSIPLGRNFVEYLDERVSQCDVLLAVIGKRWLEAKNDEGDLRLQDENDFVRIEITSGLKREDITVVPVLVEGANIPKKSALPAEMRELSLLNAAELRPGRGYKHDVNGLLKALEDIEPSARKQLNPEPLFDPNNPDHVIIEHPSEDITEEAISEAAGKLTDELTKTSSIKSDSVPANLYQPIAQIIDPLSPVPPSAEIFGDAPIPEGLQTWAEAGDANAQYNLGRIFANGEGVPKDYTEAFKWYLKAAGQNFPQAQHNLGKMYETGEGVEEDWVEAVKWYNRAAQQGYSLAQSNIGWMYESGRGVEQDYEQAFEWYVKAAEQGLSKAQTNLGVKYWTGDGTDKDMVKCLAWWILAAEQGYKYAVDWKSKAEAEMSFEKIAEAEALSKELQKKIEVNLKEINE